ncbi:MAG: glycosyltransferase family 4 protein [Gammaproteobacteria bacterium]
MQKSILFFVTEDWAFYHYRLPIARAAQSAGFKIYVLTHVNQHQALIEQEGFHVINLNLTRGSINPFKELRTLFYVIKAYRSIKPTLVHHITLKPILYGTFAALLTGRLHIVNAFTGLGYIFTSHTLKAKLIKPIVLRTIRWLFNQTKPALIVQNSDDFAFFTQHNIPAYPLQLIRGSGIDINHFYYKPEPSLPIVITIVSRLLQDKGINEFLNAAVIVKQQAPEIIFKVIGEIDLHNPSSLTNAELASWQAKNIVKFLGKRSDIAEIWRESHIAVLPSYREGLPRALLEAAATGRPLITTDVPGCRELVIDGKNGLLVPARNSQALANAMLTLIKDSSLRQRLGYTARQIVEQIYSDETVAKQTLALYDLVLNK